MDEVETDPAQIRIEIPDSLIETETEIVETPIETILEP